MPIWVCHALLACFFVRFSQWRRGRETCFFWSENLGPKLPNMGPKTSHFEELYGLNWKFKLLHSLCYGNFAESVEKLQLTYLLSNLTRDAAGCRAAFGWVFVSAVCKTRQVGRMTLFTIHISCPNVTRHVHALTVIFIRHKW